MSIFEARDYKKWVVETVEAMAKGGRGQYASMANYLGISPTIVTQVFRGDRELTAEQAVLLCEFFGLNKPESRHFILLVNYARAGSVRYKKILLEEIEESALRAEELKNRVTQDLQLTEEAKSILYANWYYLAVWSFCALPETKTLETISDRLKLPRRKIGEALEFLKKYGLIAEEAGEFKIRGALLHLESDSPHIARHHQNWRLQAFRKYEEDAKENLFYTAPVTLSKQDAVVVREKLLQFVAEAVDLIKDSPSEDCFCLCMDWFRVGER